MTKTLTEVLNRSQTEFSDRPFLGTKARKDYEWETYAQVFRHAQYVKENLSFSPGEIVALVSDNCKEWVYIMLAALASGATLVPMYASEKVESLNFILKNANVDRVICANPKLAAELVCDRKDIFEDIDWKESGDALTLSVDDQHETAFILYTSGTTADPKGVPLSHANIAHNIEMLSMHFPLTKEDRSLSFLPWAHSFGLIAELLTLCANGASIGIAESVQTIIPNLSLVKPTILVSVPRLFSQFYASVQKRALSEGAFSKKIFDDMLGKNTGIFSSLRKSIYKNKYISRVHARFGGELKYAISGGAALSSDAAKFMEAIGIEVYEGYGLTETAAVISFNTPNASKAGSVGQPICEVLITETSDFEKNVGEICVKGKGIMKGYLNQSDTGFDKDGFFPTGDVGRLDEDGYLWILGRLKEQYKLSSGKYIAPVQLEEKLEQSPLVDTVILYGENREYNIALVQLSEQYLAEGSVKVADVLASFEKLGEEFRRFEYPKKIIIIEHLSKHPELLTPSGKLKRSNLFELYQNEIEDTYS